MACVYENRLTIARELLSADGSIWISVGKDGQHYLKVLADDIFGMDCFVADISWQRHTLHEMTLMV